MIALVRKRGGTPATKESMEEEPAAAPMPRKRPLSETPRRVMSARSTGSGLKQGGGALYIGLVLGIEPSADMVTLFARPLLATELAQDVITCLACDGRQRLNVEKVRKVFPVGSCRR